MLLIIDLVEPERFVLQRILAVCVLLLACAACNPSYLPIPTTGVLSSDEMEAGLYASFGYVGRTVRPLGFRGVIANLGLWFRKGVANGIDWTMTADTFGVTTAFGFAQNDSADTVLRLRVGAGWLSGIAGMDWATRVSKTRMTQYAVGGTAVAWIGDAFWTDDPGLSYGLRLGALGQVGGAPRWGAPISGGLRLDWAPLAFGGHGSSETILDLVGGTRNPFGRPYGSRYFAAEGWPRPTVSFDPAAWSITGGPGVTYHQNRGNWTQGGDTDTTSR